MFLMDGTPGGRIKSTVANWTGLAYRIPRTEIERCKNISYLKQSGVYFLFGTSDDTGKPVAYIGQAGNRKNGEGILERLSEHKKNPEKDYWIEAVVFTTSNNSFGPTEISFLENKFCSLAIKAGRYEVKNANDPFPGHITEEKESELEEFAEYAKIIMGTFGHKIFEPLDSTQKISVESDNNDVEEIPLLFLKRHIKSANFTVEATGRQTSEGFVVLKGSKISPDEKTKVLGPGIIKARKNANIDSKNILREDVLFQSPSSAAGFVTGNSSNGLKDWKTKDGISLKDL